MVGAPSTSGGGGRTCLCNAFGPSAELRPSASGGCSPSGAMSAPCGCSPSGAMSASDGCSPSGANATVAWKTGGVGSVRNARATTSPPVSPSSSSPPPSWSCLVMVVPRMRSIERNVARSCRRKDRRDKRLDDADDSPLVLVALVAAPCCEAARRA